MESGTVHGSIFPAVSTVNTVDSVLLDFLYLTVYISYHSAAAAAAAAWTTPHLWTHMLLKFKLFLLSQAAGICSSAGEKVTAICQWAGVRSLKAAYNKQVLPVAGSSSSSEWFLEKKRKRTGGIVAEDISASTKLSKLISHHRSEILVC